MHALYTISVLVHVLAACTWIGALIFFAAIVVPVVRRPEYASVRVDLVRTVGRRFRVLGWTSVAILVSSGVTNLVLRGIGMGSLTSDVFWRTEFGRVLSYKLAFVALAVLSTAAHDTFAMRSRRLSSWLGRATLLFSLGAVAFAVWLVRGLP